MTQYFAMVLLLKVNLLIKIYINFLGLYLDKRFNRRIHNLYNQRLKLKY